MSKPNAFAAEENFEFEALNRAENYRRVLLCEFDRFLRGHVLEIGAGIGQITHPLSQLPNVEEVLAVEPSESFARTFKELHPQLPILQGTASSLNGHLGFDAALCVNVLEHIEHDVEELKEFHRLLKPRGGHLCLFVPARMEIYAPLDRDFGHFRRYHRPELREKLLQTGFQIQRLQYFNFIGYFAWWWSFKVRGSRQFNPGAVQLFDRVIFPVTHALESVVGAPPVGQSLLAVAQAV